ncbi:MAG: hypothetical protein RI885_28 [Actinomycetota bacterium]|jgi:AcrR family transcriptional regulator
MQTGTPPLRRADARHNIDRIIAATVDCLSRQPSASIADIAHAAGVGRVTVYGHFPTREALVEAALKRVLADGDQVLKGVDLGGDPRIALQSLIESSWLLTAQASAVLEAARHSLPPGRIQALHESSELRVHELIRRGQAEGVFRQDLPAPWLTDALHHLMKGAAADVSSGRLAAVDAPRWLVATVLAAYSVPNG